MPIKKYVEIEWTEVRLKPFQDKGTTQIYMNVSANYPTPYVPQNISERLISGVLQDQKEDGNWVIKPRNYPDRMLFSGYVEDLLEIGISVLESDKNSMANRISQGIGKLSEASEPVGKAFSTLFPFVGISKFVFSGIANLMQDRDDFLGMFLYQLRRETVIPIGRPVVGKLQKGSECVGEVELVVYIQPDETSSSVFYRDVEVFPFSPHEIGVYYSGKLIDKQTMYVLYSMNEWKTKDHAQMKKRGNYWMALLQIPESMRGGTCLEIAFVDEHDREWDSKDGSNWCFDYFRWI